jgi:hypothetical protein
MVDKKQELLIPRQIVSPQLADLHDFFEFFGRIMAEMDRRYDERFGGVNERFTAAGTAVTAALAAQEKAVAAAFLASEKAIVKAEDSQKDYNERSNEFRGQLDDQAKMLMPRMETTALLKAMDDKIESVKIYSEAKIDALKLSIEKSIDAMSKEIAGLRESRSEGSGKETAHDARTGQANWLIGLVVSGVIGITAIAVAILLRH